MLQRLEGYVRGAWGGRRNDGGDGRWPEEREWLRCDQSLSARGARSQQITRLHQRGGVTPLVRVDGRLRLLESSHMQDDEDIEGSGDPRTAFGQ